MHHPASSDLTRRHLLRAALAGSITAPFLSTAESPVATTAVVAPGSFREPGQDLPLVADADVIVCGGGPAGVSAAIAAARAGARVRLFEWRGCLGGVWTAGLVTYFLDFHKPGFNAELDRAMRARDIRRGTDPNSIACEPEELKLLLEDLCSEAGVRIQLHTRVTAAFRDGRRLTTIVTDSKSGRQAWQAPVFIDATGDGDLGAAAGCSWVLGEGIGCPCQPMSLNALLVVRDADAIAPFLHTEKEHARAKAALLAELGRAGIVPSYGKPTLWQMRDNLLLAMVNHEYGVVPTDAAAVTAATMRARAEVHRMVKGLRRLGGPWDGLQIAATAEQIGVRDGRRIKGRFTVTGDDLAVGARHPDAVARAAFPVDIHALKHDDAPYSNRGVKAKPYDIPLRALMAAEVDGLMMAGRCISGDFIAHASYRVTGNAVAMGEAAGACAAIAATGRKPPHEVPWDEVARTLERIRRPG